ncbi:Crp/Fnr family transcriptional regulator [Ramlibacter albus]|uniref:Crp/Fnr family transcriptional regulator n=1 Tax=Ramlibacter albus TaxID=2079448 RepID=A0A923S7M1_9BURK|nr:Crp/Fnr family transcriptional regulator [Ramlibacter albus]MBC5767257.1 Crp/Fnr family transcriptional regulator [Ramlibacter albus]
MHDVPPASLGLRRISLLEGLGTEKLDRIARQCAWRRYEPGQVLISRESPSRDVHLIIAGRVRVTIYTASGRQVTFRDLGEGETVGEVSAIDGGNRSADVVALTDVVAATLARADFLQWLDDEPQLARRFMARMAGLVRLLSEKVVELSTLGVQNRIHADLLRLAREAPAADGPRRRISPAPKHIEIASRVSTTREQVTRELSALTKRGLLAKEGDALVVTDVALLQRMVEQASLEA